MQFTRKKKQHSDAGVVLTSLLDINFLLIMFFLMTAHFQRETHALLNLPLEQGEEQAQPDEASLVINVTSAGEIIVSNRRTTMADLRQKVRAQVDAARRSGSGGSNVSVKLMIRADRDAQTQQLNPIVMMLRELGVGTIRIATEVPI